MCFTNNNQLTISYGFDHIARYFVKMKPGEAVVVISGSMVVSILGLVSMGT